jgi:riboflavin kinase/FMN adenylyltransferase
MQHYKNLDALKLGGCALTIGSFDGVHRGHQDLIRSMVEDAQAANLPSVVLTFFPHPSVVLRKRQPAFYINTPEEKAQLLGELGVEYVVTHAFDHEFSKVPAGDFLSKLVEGLEMQRLWVGEDFALGHNREGNVRFLQQEASQRGFQLHVKPPVKIGGEVISSTRVREALRSGDVARVGRYLGRPFAIPGVVEGGAGRGKQLGIPTANLRIWEKRAYPAAGVYACFAELGSDRYQAVSNIGVRPTFEENQNTPVVEAHLLDFEGDIYERELRLSFIDRLRDERRFSGPEELLHQIGRDIRRARQILNQKTEGDDD